MGMRKIEQVTARARPFVTHYYEHHLAVVGQFSKTGRAASELGAVRAAVVNVLRGKYDRADIHGESGEKLFSVIRIHNTITVQGMFKALTFDK